MIKQHLYDNGHLFVAMHEKRADSNATDHKDFSDADAQCGLMGESGTEIIQGSAEQERVILLETDAAIEPHVIKPAGKPEFLEWIVSRSEGCSYNTSTITHPRKFHRKRI